MTRREKLLRLCEFDESKALNECFQQVIPNHAKHTWTWEVFSSASQWQHDRLLPILTALIDENEKLRSALENIKKEDGGYMINPSIEQFESYMFENVVHHMRKEASEALTTPSPLDAFLSEGEG
jgi:hypothetical protein